MEQKRSCACLSCGSSFDSGLEFLLHELAIHDRVGAVIRQATLKLNVPSPVPNNLQ